MSNPKSENTFYDLYTLKAVKKPNVEMYYPAFAHERFLNLEEKRKNRKVKMINSKTTLCQHPAWIVLRKETLCKICGFKVKIKRNYD